jgi:multimeric flavodoxin WrbA
MKILAICGSPREGNTEFMLRTILDAATGEKELILLREKNIKHCQGCLYCDSHKTECAIKDDMQELYKKLEKAGLIIIGTPNYFDNVPGLMKDFIDRTNPYYETGKLKGKKLFILVSGGGEPKNSKRLVNQALKYFANCHELEIVGDYCVQALKTGEAKKEEVISELKKIGESLG